MEKEKLSMYYQKIYSTKNSKCNITFHQIIRLFLQLFVKNSIILATLYKTTKLKQNICTQEVRGGKVSPRKQD